MNSMTQQRREGEANGPQGQRPARVSRGGPSWTEFVRPAHQAVVAFAGADMINRAEPRACGRSRGSRRLDTELGTKEPQALCQTQPQRLRKGAGWQGRASNRNGENPPYGMNRGGGGNVSMTWRPFATMLERADTTEVAGLNWARLRSTRPVIGGVGAVVQPALVGEGGAEWSGVGRAAHREEQTDEKDFVCFHGISV
jgi:hypothetical protein